MKSDTVTNPDLVPAEPVPMKILNAILHQPVGVPGVMPPNVNINATKLPGIKLKWDENIGLIWKVKNREGFFPSTTVAVVETAAGTFWPNGEGKDKSKAA